MQCRVLLVCLSDSTWRASVLHSNPQVNQSERELHCQKMLGTSPVDSTQFQAFLCGVLTVKSVAALIPQPTQHGAICASSGSWSQFETQSWYCVWGTVPFTKHIRGISGNVGIAIINHPPFITINGLYKPSKNGWFMTLRHTHITTV